MAARLLLRSFAIRVTSSKRNLRLSSCGNVWAGLIDDLDLGQAKQAKRPALTTDLHKQQQWNNQPEHPRRHPENPSSSQLHLDQFALSQGLHYFR
jgi:hypothetical protein